MAVGEELDGVDIRLMAGKGLDGLSGTDVPQLSEGVAGAGDEGVLVRRVQADAHHVAEVIGKLHGLTAGLDIPLHAGHVTGRGQDAPVVDEPTAGKVPGVTGQLAGDPGGPVAVLIKVVD